MNGIQFGKRMEIANHCITTPGISVAILEKTRTIG